MLEIYVWHGGPGSLALKRMVKGLSAPAATMQGLLLAVMYKTVGQI